MDPTLLVGDLPKDEGLLHRFFRWRSRYGGNVIILLLDGYRQAPHGERVEQEEGLGMDLVEHRRLTAAGELVGQFFRTPPNALVRPTAGYVYVGSPHDGAYQPLPGMDGVQAYEGDSDIILISAGIGWDSYLSKVSADIIV